MQLINPTFSNISLTNNSLNDLLDDIDYKIGDMATIQYLNDSYGLTSTVDLNLYEELCDFKEILLQKLLGCGCLECNNLNHITSIIQTLIDKC